LSSAGTVSFWCMGNLLTGNGDSSSFLIDGVTQNTNGCFTGTYTKLSFAAGSGTHTFDWRVISGFWQSATMYVDDVQVTNAAGTPTAAIINGGNVGIGTSTPTQTLEVDGTGLFKVGSTTALQVQNAAGTNLMNVDSTNARIGIDNTYTAMTTPTGLTAAAPTNGGTLTLSTTYFYKVTAIDSAGGETLPSTEASRAIAASGTLRQIPVSWTAVTGASGYKLYRSTTTGTEVYLTTVLTNSFTDSGSIAAGTGTPPGTSTAYTSTNNSGSSLQLSVGGLGTPTGQVYVSGSVPSSYLAKLGLSDAYHLAVEGRYAYVAEAGAVDKLDVIDISNPAAPLMLSSVGTGAGTDPISVKALGRYVYVLSSATVDTIQVYDVSNPSSPSLVGSTPAGILSAPNDFYVQGRYAYVTDSNLSKLLVIDISNPAAQVLVTSITGGLSYPQGVFVYGSNAYVTDLNTGGVYIFNISNPSSPTQVGSVTAGLQFAYDIYVQGRYAYVADQGSSGNLDIIDVSNPASPKVISTLSVDSTSTPWQVYVQGRYAYISGTHVNVVDVSNPYAPRSVGIITSGLTNPTNVVIQGRYLYTGDFPGAFLTYDMGGAYSQQLEAGGAEFGTLAVDSNSIFAGDVNIQGGLSTGSILASGNLGLAGGAYLQGGAVLGGGNNQLGAPSGTPSISFTGTTGGSSVTWQYVVTAVNAYGGESTASATGSIAAPASSNSTLTASNYNTISWSAVTGAVNYKVYRVGASGGNPSSTGYIGSTSGTSFNDKGLMGIGGSAPTTDTSGQLTVLGSALFKNTSNSATAFQVQNSSGVSLFSVDTSASTITLGSASSTPVLLVLGNKNTSGDPSCVNGALYYNSNTNRFRACTNGTWATFGAFAPGYELSYDQITSNASLTSTTEAGANTAITSTSVTYDGSTVAMVDVYVPNMNTANSTGLGLWLDGTEQFGHIWAVNAAGDTGMIEFKVRVTLSAGSHTLTVRGWDTGGTGTLNAGTGTAGANSYPPAYVRVIVAQ
jgi:hypothetical protein